MRKTSTPPYRYLIAILLLHFPVFLAACQTAKGDKESVPISPLVMKENTHLRTQYVASLKEELLAELIHGEMSWIQRTIEEAASDPAVVKARIIGKDRKIPVSSVYRDIGKRTGDDLVKEVRASKESRVEEAYTSDTPATRHLVPLLNESPCRKCHNRYPLGVVLGVLDVWFHLRDDEEENTLDLRGKWYSMPPDRVGKKHKISIYGPKTFDVIGIAQSGRKFRGLVRNESATFSSPESFRGVLKDRQIEQLECTEYFKRREPSECKGSISKNGNRIDLEYQKGKIVLFRESARPSWLPYGWVEPDLRQKVGMTKANLYAIYSVEVSYLAEWNVYVGNQPFTPVADRQGRSEKIPWDPRTRFAIMGLDMNSVFCSYSLAGEDFPAREEGFTAVAHCDLDGDGELSIWTITDKRREISHSGDDY